MVTGGEWIYGRNPVEEALAAGRRTASDIVLPPYFPEEDDQIQRIRDEARTAFVNYAHRGASEYLPENTMLAFYTGLYMNANGMYS